MHVRGFRRLAAALAMCVPLAWGQTRISLDERLWVASKIYASIPIYFAHWQGAGDLDLDAAYKDYLKAATAAETRWDFDHLTLEFMARLRNGHTRFWDTFLNRAGGAPIGFAAIPIDGKWTVIERQIDQVRIGDIIERIDGAAMDSFFASKRKYISASSEAAAQRAFFYHKHLFPQQFLLHLSGGANVEIDRFTQKLRPPEVRPVEARWIEQPAVAYVRIRSFDNPRFEQSAVDAVGQFRDARAIVLDVRGNGGGTTPEGLLRAVMDRPYRDWSQASAASVGLFRAYAKVPELVGPGELSERDAGYYRAFSEFAFPQLVAPGGLIQPEGALYRGRILVLTDFDSASACEDFVMPLKYSGRATVVGERTPRLLRAAVPLFYNFGNGMSFGISARRMYFPDGAEFEGVGIAPDVEVRPSVSGLREGKDVALARALSLAAAAPPPAAAGPPRSNPAQTRAQ